MSAENLSDEAADELANKISACQRYSSLDRREILEILKSKNYDESATLQCLDEIFPPEPVEQFAQFVGCSDRELLGRLLEQSGGRLEEACDLYWSSQPANSPPRPPSRRSSVSAPAAAAKPLLTAPMVKPAGRLADPTDGFVYLGVTEPRRKTQAARLAGQTVADVARQLEELPVERRAAFLEEIGSQKSRASRTKAVTSHKDGDGDEESNVAEFSDCSSQADSVESSASLNEQLVNWIVEAVCDLGGFVAATDVAVWLKQRKPVPADQAPDALRQTVGRVLSRRFARCTDKVLGWLQFKLAPDGGYFEDVPPEDVPQLYYSSKCLPELQPRRAFELVVPKPLFERNKHSFYGTARVDGLAYSVGDRVLAQGETLPYIAILKRIFAIPEKRKDGSAKDGLSVWGDFQWYYRPEDLTADNVKLPRDLAAHEVFLSERVTENELKFVLLGKCAVVATDEEYKDVVERCGKDNVFLCRRTYDTQSKKTGKLFHIGRKRAASKPTPLSSPEIQKRLRLTGSVGTPDDCVADGRHVVPSTGQFDAGRKRPRAEKLEARLSAAASGGEPLSSSSLSSSTSIATAQPSAFDNLPALATSLADMSSLGNPLAAAADASPRGPETSDLPKEVVASFAAGPALPYLPPPEEVVADPSSLPPTPQLVPLSPDSPEPVPPSKRPRMTAAPVSPSLPERVYLPVRDIEAKFSAKDKTEPRSTLRHLTEFRIFLQNAEKRPLPVEDIRADYAELKTCSVTIHARLVLPRLAARGRHEWAVGESCFVAIDHAAEWALELREGVFTLWIRTRSDMGTWYQLLDPLPDYAPLFDPMRRRMDLCDEVFKIVETCRGQPTREHVSKLLEERGKFPASMLVEHAAFLDRHLKPQLPKSKQKLLTFRQTPRRSAGSATASPALSAAPSPTPSPTPSRPSSPTPASPALHPLPVGTRAMRKSLGNQPPPPTAAPSAAGPAAAALPSPLSPPSVGASDRVDAPLVVVAARVKPEPYPRLPLDSPPFTVGPSLPEPLLDSDLSAASTEFHPFEDVSGGATPPPPGPPIGATGSTAEVIRAISALARSPELVPPAAAARPVPAQPLQPVSLPATSRAKRGRPRAPDRAPSTAPSGLLASASMATPHATPAPAPPVVSVAAAGDASLPAGALDVLRGRRCRPTKPPVNVHQAPVAPPADRPHAAPPLLRPPRRLKRVAEALSKASFPSEDERTIDLEALRIVTEFVHFDYMPLTMNRDKTFRKLYGVCDLCKKQLKNVHNVAEVAAHLMSHAGEWSSNVSKLPDDDYLALQKRRLFNEASVRFAMEAGDGGALAGLDGRASQALQDPADAQASGGWALGGPWPSPVGMSVRPLPDALPAPRFAPGKPAGWWTTSIVASPAGSLTLSASDVDLPQADGPAVSPMDVEGWEIDLNEGSDD